MTIQQDKREAVKTLFSEGKKKKEIARLLNITPKTVRRILAVDTSETTSRSDKRTLNIELLRNLYSRCEGYVERIHEILSEEHSIDIGYSTLTRIVRNSGIGRKTNKRCYHYGDVPGEEMQQDTTIYRLQIGGQRVRVVCSALYLRYSKMRYVKFYRYFDRFKMKGFFHEALRYWNYTAGTCIVDNTNLVVSHNSGSQAVFYPEMIAFAKNYGFNWAAHEKGHANRKAGKERNFWTIETNFLPGRTFSDIADLNRQAFEWATVRYANRPMSRTHLIPVALFEEEKTSLIKLPPYIQPPYQQHKRIIDSYGYIAFKSNYYWVPGKSTGEVSLIEYSDKIKLFPQDGPAVEYLLPAYETRNEKFVHESADSNPYQPKNIKKPCAEEEKRLRAAGEICCLYLDFINSNNSGIKQKPRFKRELYGLTKKMVPSLFTAVIERALKYRVADISALVRIARQLMGGQGQQLQMPAVTGDYENRDAYMQGKFSQETDKESYKKLFEDKEE